MLKIHDLWCTFTSTKSGVKRFFRRVDLKAYLMTQMLSKKLIFPVEKGFDKVF